MADTYVTLNKRGLREWLTSSAAQDACMPSARRIEARARELAPSGKSGKAGELRRSHMVERGVGGRYRTRVWVVADTKYAFRIAARDNWMQRAIDAARRP